MKKAFLPFLCLFALLFAFGGQLNAQVGQVAFIEGTVVNAELQPLPGVTVSLAHQVLGRSTPVTTNLAGYFSFTNIPIHPMPYYIEIYWGDQLIYRNIFAVYRPYYSYTMTLGGLGPVVVY